MNTIWETIKGNFATLMITAIIALTCSHKINPSGWRESTKMKIGDSSDEKDFYGRANRRDFAWI